MELQQPVAIDLFSGAGGMSTGFMKAGINIKLAIEKNSSAAKTYKHNHPNTSILNKDIQSLEISNLGYKNQEIDLIFGGFPCKPFSNANRNKRNRESLFHPDLYLYQDFLRFIEYFSPKVFVVENVGGINSIVNPDTSKSILDEFLEFTQKLGYYVNWQILRMTKFGIPQDRDRIFLIGGKKHNIPIPEPPYPDPNEWITVEDAISDLPFNTTTNPHEVLDYSTCPQTKYQKARRISSNILVNHFCTEHKSEAIKKFSTVPPGGNWRNIPTGLFGNKDTKNKHSNLYRRLEWNKPAPTITHIRKTMLIHPSENRTLSAREAARLQGFDDNYHFFGNKNEIYQQITDAVSPIVAEVIAKKVINYL
jgi:DNA (cytosine-5)-methyltransferase 1